MPYFSPRAGPTTRHHINLSSTAYRFLVAQPNKTTHKLMILTLISNPIHPSLPSHPLPQPHLNDPSPTSLLRSPISPLPVSSAGSTSGYGRGQTGTRSQVPRLDGRPAYAARPPWLRGGPAANGALSEFRYEYFSSRAVGPSVEWARARIFDPMLGSGRARVSRKTY